MSKEIIIQVLGSETEKLRRQYSGIEKIRKEHTPNSHEWVRLGGKLEGISVAIENMRQTISLHSKPYMNKTFKKQV